MGATNVVGRVTKGICEMYVRLRKRKTKAKTEFAVPKEGDAEMTLAWDVAGAGGPLSLQLGCAEEELCGFDVCEPRVQVSIVFSVNKEMQKEVLSS